MMKEETKPNGACSVVIRKSEAPFAQIPNETLRDNRLSYEASGLLAELLSHAEGWTIRKDQIMKSRNIGNHKLQRMFRELKDAGYARIVTIKDETTNRFAGSYWEVSGVADARETGFQAAGKQRRDKNTISKEYQSKGEYPKGKNNIAKQERDVNEVSNLNPGFNTNQKRKGEGVLGEGIPSTFKFRSLDEFFERAFKSGLEPQWKQAGHSFTCFCPCHEDKQSGKPNLTITQGEGHSIMCHCFSCHAKTADVRKELFGGKVPNQVREHIYTDLDGTMVGKKVKLKNGKFSWYRLTDGKREFGKPEGLKPYRITELVSEPEMPVYICEGEKDADTLAKLGLKATSVPHGAGNWNTSHNKYVSSSSRIYIVADMDDAGTIGVEKVADALFPLFLAGTWTKKKYEQAKVRAGKAIYVVEPTLGKDITDHFEAGGSLEDCRVRTFEEYEQNLVEARFRIANADVLKSA